jgi:hypothetical protein
VIDYLKSRDLQKEDMDWIGQLLFSVCCR